MTLSQAQFHDLIDRLQQQVEDVFDDSDLDVDLESSGGVLTIRFENGSQLILSRQEPIRQLWLAARSGGFHFDYRVEDGVWVTAEGQRLGELLEHAVRDQGGAALSFPGL